MSPYHSTHPLHGWDSIKAKDATTVLFILNECLRSRRLTKWMTPKERDSFVKNFRRMLINEEKAGTLALESTCFIHSKIWWEHTENPLQYRDVGELEQMGYIRCEHEHKGCEEVVE